MGHPRKTWQYGTPAKPAKAETPESKKKENSRLSKLSPFRTSRKDEKSKASSQEHPEVTAGNKTSDCFWPLDLIPDDFPNLRIMTYGYDSYLTHFYKGKTNQMTISQHAQKLLEQITNARAACRGRPITFVVHSLGGVLVKDMIIESGKYKHQPNLQDVSKSCFAIFFFGTPHLGATSAQYGEMIGNVVGSVPGGFSIYKEILRGLKPDGEKLTAVNADFNDILNDTIPVQDKLRIYSFQEGKLCLV
jgi:hypothetical protein